MVVWIPFQDQIDQYLAKHPQIFFDRPHEHAIVDLSNPYILAGHLLCATAERPLAATDIDQYFGPIAYVVTINGRAHRLEIPRSDDSRFFPRRPYREVVGLMSVRAALMGLCPVKLSCSGECSEMFLCSHGTLRRVHIPRG